MRVKQKFSEYNWNFKVIEILNPKNVIVCFILNDSLQCRVPTNYWFNPMVLLCYKNQHGETTSFFSIDSKVEKLISITNKQVISYYLH